MVKYADAFFKLPAIFKDPTNPVDAASAKELTKIRDKLRDEWYDDQDDMRHLLGGYVPQMERQARKERMKDREKRNCHLRKRFKWLRKATYAQRKEDQEREKLAQEERAAARERERAHHNIEEGMHLLGQWDMMATIVEDGGLGDDLGFQLDEYGGGQL